MDPPRSAAAASAVLDWSAYFDAVAECGPREMLVDAAERFEREGLTDQLAVDLGCGTGRDTIELLKRGWRVLAIDGEQEAIDRMVARPELASHTAGLETRVSRFDSVELPPCRLVNASFSLPFCAAEVFDRLWQNIRESLLSGGRFAGHFLGDQDEWATLPGRTHHTRAEVDDLLAGFEVETLKTELYGPDPESQHPKRWHIFGVVARRLSS